LDSGNDSQDNFTIVRKFPNIHFLVKRNLRKESLDEWLVLAQNTENAICSRYNHKTVWTGKTPEESMGMNYLTQSHSK